MAIFYQISQIEDEVDDVNKTEFEKLEKSLEEKSPETWWYCETRDVLWDTWWYSETRDDIVSQRLCYLTSFWVLSPNNKWRF